jgi:hypothetical protein
LPAEAKQQITDRYKDNVDYRKEVEDLIRFMIQGESSDGSKLKRVTDESDRHRKQHLSDHHSELAKAIGYE